MVSKWKSKDLEISAGEISTAAKGELLHLSGSFKQSENELVNKARKAYSILIEYFFWFNPNIPVSLHVFDHTMKPILMYRLELWGAVRTDIPKFQNGTIDLVKIYHTSSADSFHITSCKYNFGVHKKSSYLAVLSGLGRSPIYFDTMRTILVYGNRLENISRGSNYTLLKDAYLLSKSLHENGKLTASLYSSFN